MQRLNIFHRDRENILFILTHESLYIRNKKQNDLRWGWKMSQHDSAVNNRKQKYMKKNILEWSQTYFSITHGRAYLNCFAVRKKSLIGFYIYVFKVFLFFILYIGFGTLMSYKLTTLKFRKGLMTHLDFTFTPRGKCSFLTFLGGLKNHNRLW